MTATPAWLASIEAMLNRNLGESAQAAGEARRLEGKCLQVEVTSILRLRACVRAGHLFLSSGEDQGADAVISGSAVALLNLLADNTAHPSRGPAAQVRGDAEVANRFRGLLQLLKPDFEAEISRLIGDVPAHGLARFAQAAASWGRRAVASTRQNIAEYLQEESRDLVNKTELEEFLRGVDQVREAADRAEARLASMERRMGNS